MFRTRRIARDVHGEVVLAGRITRILEGVQTIAVVIDGIAGAEGVGRAVDRQPQRTRLDGHVLARAVRVRQEHAGIHLRAERGAHELELDAGEYGREDPALPPGQVPRDFLVVAAQQDQPGGRLGAEQAGQARIQPGCDAIEHQDGRGLHAALDRREHAAAHAGAGAERLERKPAPFALGPDARAERRQGQIPMSCGRRA